jgi:hypothetical protein
LWTKLPANKENKVESIYVKIMIKTTILMTILFWNCQNLFAQKGIFGFDKEIEPYIDYIKEQQDEPISFLLQKLKTHDVIVFGERDHRDITQYYFIENLINTEEFYKQVSTIYTEVGSSNFNDTLNNVLQNSSLSYDKIEKLLIGIYREISYQGIWEKYNFYYLLKTVYDFNKLHPDYLISVKMTGHPFDWNEITDTVLCKLKTDEVEANYDKSMAEFFLKSFEENQNSVRNKAFVIMNYPHSLRKFTSKENITYERMFGAYINRKLSDRVYYVIVNPYTLTLQPVANGKWDAAFKYCDNKTIGFDFQNSPFGKDTFDVWWTANGILSFEELYDGMIYINPASECENVTGIPGFIDKRFAKEYMRRKKLRMYYNGQEYKTKLRWEKEEYNNLRSLTVHDYIEKVYGKDRSNCYETIVNKWLMFE